MAGNFAMLDGSCQRLDSLGQGLGGGDLGTWRWGVLRYFFDNRPVIGRSSV